MNAEERLIAFLCQRPGTEHMDTHHADMARQILGQHAQEIAARQSSVRFGRTEGLGVIPLADMLRDDATALAALDHDEIARTDDPLTLLRCLHATVQALADVTPDALAAAHITDETDGVANLPGLVSLGLKGAAAALWDAYNAV